MLHQLERNDIKSFVTAGKAIVTLESGKTGTRYTYKIDSKKESDKFFFVSILTGRDNDGDYTYLGYLKDGKMHFSQKSAHPAESKPSKAFTYFVNHIDKIPDQLHVYHSCKCGRCGRTLTTPESIKRGLGPECTKLSI